jgi:hypothetical protein
VKNAIPLKCAAMYSRIDRKENQQPPSSATEEIVYASESDEGEVKSSNLPPPTRTTTPAALRNPYKEGPGEIETIGLSHDGFPGVVGSEEKDDELEREVTRLVAF